MRRPFSGEKMIKKLYPQGKDKAFNISYDDGVIQDVRFVNLLNQYGLKGTFNLNSGLMKQEFEWVHENGMVVKRLPEAVVQRLYTGHEVASHTYSHPYMDALSRGDILSQMAADRFFLQQLTRQEVAGFAVPFLHYSPLIADCARECGFAYARISEESHSYLPPEDHFWWRGGKFHWDGDLEDYVAGFLQTDIELALCQLVGHSYDLDVYHMWDRMEQILRMVAVDESVAPMTNLELARYLAQMKKVEITSEAIYNPGNCDLWFRVDGETVCLHPEETFIRKD